MNDEEQAIALKEVIIICLRSENCESTMQIHLKQSPWQALPPETKTNLLDIAGLGQHFYAFNDVFYEKINRILESWTLPDTDKLTIEEYAKLRDVAKLSDQLKIVGVRLDENFSTKIASCRKIVEYAELEMEKKYSPGMYNFLEYHLNHNAEFCLKLSKFVGVNLSPELTPKMDKNRSG